ncbi:Gpi18-like mannosyltransferase [Clostridium beijerinckii]|uniref:hypothetical protein n=1 Tax=Clostridium beijerinckii TaxID=1520 RepID=UPI001494801B|nr:hypothetical protein [Clostridium beijerinckii]NOW87143.1 Gpi18-like mannosyltransferase [Clostridium beijerinckii]
MESKYNIKAYLDVIDRQILNFIHKNIYTIFIISISVLAFMIRFIFFDIHSADYDVYIRKWGEYLTNNNGFLGIRSIDSDYNVPYLYILACFTYIPGSYILKVKLFSVVFDYIGAVACYLIVKKLLKDNKSSDITAIITYSLVLFIPTVILNSSAWAQCDIIYVTFVLFSIYYLIDKKYSRAFLFYGIAIAFKLQAIFVFPLYIILYFSNKNFSIINFFIISIVNILLYIPALLFGRPLNLLWRVYFNQTQEYTSLTLNFPNIYNLVYGNDILKRAGIIFSITIIGILFVYILKKKMELTSIEIVEFALLLVLVETYFLPFMHDRYMFLADILSMLYFIVRKNIIVPIIIIAMSLNSYIAFLFGIIPIPLKMASVIQFFIVIKVLGEFLNISDRRVILK